MRKRLLRWLVCPICQGPLTVVASGVMPASIKNEDFETLGSVAPNLNGDLEEEIHSGALICAVCRVYYPIYNGVPRMLTYPTDVARIHKEENAKWIEERLTSFSLPSLAPPPGEEDVLRNFSTEWTQYKWSGESYWSATPARVLDWMRFSLGTTRHPLHGKLALEVGIGIGGIADGLSREEDCEIIGVDLSYAVDQAKTYFGANPRLHIVQASVFALPFQPSSFDVVYSQGVIHHTHSTQKAFDQLAHLPKTDGMLYVWVYSHRDESATFLRRILMAIENGVRPILSRLPRSMQTLALAPVVIPYIVYQNIFRRRKLGAEGTALYGWSEALHAARDRLTPPFAFRHSYEEVADWFYSHSFGKLELLRDERLPEGFPETIQLCVGIRGFKLAGQKNDAEKSR